MTRRSTAQILAEMPDNASAAVYAMARIDGVIDQMVNVLELAGPEARALVFAQNPRADRTWHIADCRPARRRRGKR